MKKFVAATLVAIMAMVLAAGALAAGNMTLDYTVARIVELFLEDFANYCDGRPLARRVEPGKGY